MEKITQENLIAYGWKKAYSPLDDEYPTYSKCIKDKYFCDLTYGLSNRPDKDWVFHVDDDYRESIASLDVDTYEEIEALMNIIVNNENCNDDIVEIIESEANKRYYDLSEDCDLYRYHGFIEGAKWMYSKLNHIELN